MLEEIKFALGEIQFEEWRYRTLLAQLKRCRAVLLKALCLYLPLMTLLKWTSKKAQTLKVGERTLTELPYCPGISIILSLLAT